MSRFTASAAPAAEGDAPRGPWAWLQDLVRDAGARTHGDAGPRPALADALQGMGFSPRALLEGIAAVLGIAADEMADPDAATIGRADPARLAAVLPPLLDHHAHDVRRAAQRWVSCPALAYSVPPEIVEGWLRGSGPMAVELEPRLGAEGLALLGPAALHRLAVVAVRPGVREAAQRWLARVEV